MIPSWQAGRQRPNAVNYFSKSTLSQPRMLSSHPPSGSSYDGFGTSVGFDLRYTKSPSAVSVMPSIWTCCSVFRMAATAKDRVRPWRRYLSLLASSSC